MTRNGNLYGLRDSDMTALEGGGIAWRQPNVGYDTPIEANAQRRAAR